jgi:hypothetical protein
MQTADQLQRTSDRPIEMTQTNVRIEIDNVPEATRHRGGYEKTRAWAPKKQFQEQKNDAALVGSAQENRPQSDKRHSKAMAGEQSQTMSARKSESLDVRKRSQTHKITPTVIVTGPEDSKPTGNLPSQRRTPSESSNVQGGNGDSREHFLAECPSFGIIDLTTAGLAKRHIFSQAAQQSRRSRSAASTPMHFQTAMRPFNRPATCNTP